MAGGLSKPRILLWLAAGLSLVALLVTGSIAWLGAQGRRELGLELDRLGDASPAPWPVAPAAPGADPVEWWRRIEQLLADPVAPDDAACAGRLAAGEDLHEIVHASLAALIDPSHAALTECERSVLLRTAEANRAAIDVALRVGEIGALEWRTPRIRDLADVEQVLRTFPVPGYLAAQEVLCQESVHRGLNGDRASEARRVSEAWRAVELVGAPRTVVGFLAWTLAVSRWTERGLLPALPHLAPEHLRELDSALELVDAPARLRQALIGERELGDAVFRWAETVPASEVDPDRRALAGWVWRRVFIAHDRATYLRLMRLGIEACESLPDVGPLRARDAEQDRLFDSDSADLRLFLSRLFLPRLLDAGLSAQGVTARIALCRAAIRARLDGAEAARAWLEAQLDPFSGERLCSRLDADGVLVLWSVGQDGAIDAPGKEKPDDVIVRVRAR